MRQELENEMRRASHAEAELVRFQSRVIEGAIAPPPPPPGGSGLLGLESTGLRGDSGIGSGLPNASSPVPLIPQAPSGPNPATGFVQPKAPPPPADTQGLASLFLSGLLGSRPRSQSPEEQRSGTGPAVNQPTGPSDCDVLFAGMQQLQDVVAKMAKGSDRDDSN